MLTSSTLIAHLFIVCLPTISTFARYCFIAVDKVNNRIINCVECFVYVVVGIVSVSIVDDTLVVAATEELSDDVDDATGDLNTPEHTNY